MAEPGRTGSRAALAGRRLVVDAARAGSRVDALLALLRPGMGLRGRRRLAEQGLVFLDGRKARPGDMARAGSVLLLADDGAAPDDFPGARLLQGDADYWFFAKPAGLHTMALAGASGGSLEAQLSALLAAAGGEGGSLDEEGYPRLLQRLDFATSGIVAAARNARARAAFREAEAQGLVTKHYVCLLDGDLDAPCSIARALVSDGGRGMRVLDRDDPDPVRATHFEPLLALHLSLPGEGDGGSRPLALAACRIARGSRHQIRAHAAALGHPLAGDGLYGSRTVLPGGTAFFLHHARLDFPGHGVVLLPGNGWLSGVLEAGEAVAADTAVRAHFGDPGA